MGTRWRGLLAPLGTSTGDGRRFQASGVTHRDLPLPLKWQRVDEGGHDTSVVVGMCDTIEIADTGAWGEGELFDDVDPAEMPRLAEDVAEAKLLTAKGVIGPSVDAGAAEAIMVEAGSDEPISEERMEEIWQEAWDSGEDPKLEVLFTAYEIAAATLVTVPAFAECGPFELLTPTDGAESAEGEPVGAGQAAGTAATDSGLLVALVAAAGPVAPADWFTDPGLQQVTPITVTGDGRIFGHIAEFSTCHVGIRELCITPPTSVHAYAHFHRYTTTTCGRDLPVPAGRLTAAHGTLTGACACCPGIDDHACNQLSLGATIAHYDRGRAVAYVVAGEDAMGIWVAGVVAPEADDRDRALLARQKVSGDWRDVAGGLELVEVLALNREKPGFPLPHTAMANGVQRSLVAAGAVSPRRNTRRAVPGGVRLDYDRLGRSVARELAGLLPAAVLPAPGTAAAVVQPPAVVDDVAVRARQLQQLNGEVAAAQATVLLADLEDIAHV